MVGVYIGVPYLGELPYSESGMTSLNRILKTDTHNMGSMKSHILKPVEAALNYMLMCS